MAFDEYFDQRSRRFSSFYRSESVSRMLGRGALFDRLSFAVAQADALHAKRVLDVGCGSGPLFAPLAGLGMSVTGVEPAPGMIELARREAARFPGLVDVVPTGWEEIPDWSGDVAEFDLAVALGVFDYVPNADALMRNMAGAATHVVASFPAPGMRTSLRNVRYGWRGVSVYGYSEAAVRRLCVESSLEVVELRPLGRAGFVLCAARVGLPSPK